MISKKDINRLPANLQRALYLALRAGTITNAQAFRVINRYRPDRGGVFTKDRKPVSEARGFDEGSRCPTASTYTGRQS